MSVYDNAISATQRQRVEHLTLKSKETVAYELLFDLF